MFVSALVMLPVTTAEMCQSFLAFNSSTPVFCHRTIRSATCRSSSVQTVRATPRLCAQPSGRPSLNVIPGVTYVAYFSRLFLLPPFPHDFLNDLQEAWNLSLNFGYLAPILFPTSAPVLHPMVEAVFHIVVCWALLLVGFASHDVLNRESKPPIQPFLLAALFLTNIVFLPYLALRSPSASASNSSAKNTQQAGVLSEKKRSALIRFGESAVVPISSLVLFGVSIPWGLFARSEFGTVTDRFASFVNLTTTSDILSYSFCVDIIVFIFFQAALVDNDSSRRSWSSENVKNRAITTAKLVPFVGLAFYLLQRSRHATLQWVVSDDGSE